MPQFSAETKYMLRRLSYFACAVLLPTVCILCTFAAIRSANPTDDSEYVGDFITVASDGIIKWVDFDVTCSAMQSAYSYDVSSKDDAVHIDWIELLAALGAKYGGDFSHFKQKDMTALVDRLKSGETMEQIQKDNKWYSYYLEAYTAVLGEFVGEYQIRIADDDSEDQWKTEYGLKVFSPIAEGFYYDHYDDFGADRSYGYTRKHLGHDMIASLGTPVTCVESGIVEELGWNQYGGWRVGIRSFDGKRYYYYAHLRQDHPYHPDIAIGSVIRAGSVVGYVGRTGYSTTENTNNMTVNHLHWGMQLIFDPSQEDGDAEIWIDLYEITRFLSSHRSTVVRDSTTKDYYRKYDFLEENLFIYGWKVNSKSYPQ